MEIMNKTKIGNMELVSSVTIKMNKLDSVEYLLGCFNDTIKINGYTVDMTGSYKTVMIHFEKVLVEELIEILDRLESVYND